MTDLDFASVVEAWQTAPVEAIHPLRSISEDSYWESGRSQALDASHWIPEGGTVIDFGCGDGRVAIPLTKLGFEVWAVDASQEMLDRLVYNPEVDHFLAAAIQSDGSNLRDDMKTDVMFDAVVCRAVLIHHGYDDATRLILALSKCLKPGGVLIADWPIGPRYERQSWTDVTTWVPAHRLAVADGAGLELVEDATPSVWRRRAD